MDNLELKVEPKLLESIEKIKETFYRQMPLNNFHSLIFEYGAAHFMNNPVLFTTWKLELDKIRQKKINEEDILFFAM